MAEHAALRAITANVPLRKQVVERLREAIIEGHLKPGERLRERELCESLAVSRTSLREGLVELESEGLIHNVPNRGPVVASISLKLAEEIYQLRAVLEGLAARMFVRHGSDAQLAELEQATVALEAVYRDFAPAPFLEAKTRFYDILLKGANNDLAAQVLRGIHARVSQLRVTSLSDPSRSQISIGEIHRIVDAIRARDEEGAWRACHEHVMRASDAALGVLRKQQAVDLTS